MSDKGIGFHYVQENMKWKVALISHMHVFGCVAYAMVVGEKMSNSMEMP